MRFKHLQIFLLVSALFILGLSLILSPDYLWWFIPLMLLALILISWGAANIRSGFFLKAFSFSSQTDSLVLTFDDGPHPNSLKVLDQLKQFGAKATFFCIGKQAEEHPDILNRMVAEGHSVGNHTYSHPLAWGWMSTSRVTNEIQQGRQTLEKISGKSIRFFRPPFGVTNPNIAKAISQMDLNVIGWDLRSLDTAIKDENRLFSRIVSQIKGKSILLFHDTQPHTARVLNRVLEHCRTTGIKIVSLEELLDKHDDA